MIKVYPPSDNPITQGYSKSHPAYDFAGRDLPDEDRCAMDGIITVAVNLYNTNWRNTGTLTTKDYGNFVTIRHADGSMELHAHLKKDSLLPEGSKVTAGQIIARIGNTGNSSGPHLHFEFRDKNNINIPVEFVKSSPQPPMNDRRPYWFDRMNSVTFKKPHEKVTDAEVEKFVSEYPGQLKRSGVLDQIARSHGFQGDTNALTHDDLMLLIRNHYDPAGITERTKSAIIALIQKYKG